MFPHPGEQRCHSYEYPTGAVPDHDPVLALSVCPVVAVPETAGRTRLAGGSTPGGWPEKAAVTARLELSATVHTDAVPHPPRPAGEGRTGGRIGRQRH